MNIKQAVMLGIESVIDMLIPPKNPYPLDIRDNSYFILDDFLPYSTIEMKYRWNVLGKFGLVNEQDLLNPAESYNTRN